MLFQITPAAMPEGYGDALLPLEDCKAWVRIELDNEDEDALVTALRDAALDMVEKYTNLFLGPRTGVVAKFDRFCSRMRVGRGPDASMVVSGVSYVGSDGEPIAMVDGAWRLDAAAGLIPAIGACWPRTYGLVTVTFDAGFAAGECPPTLITAAKLFLAHLYANREAVVFTGAAGELPLGFRMLCDPHRMPVI